MIFGPMYKIVALFWVAMLLPCIFATDKPFLSTWHIWTAPILPLVVILYTDIEGWWREKR